MEITILGIQPGTVEPGMTNQHYVGKQISLMEKLVKEQSPYIVMFPEMMTGAYFGFVTEKKWFNEAEDFETGPTTSVMLAKSRELNVHIAYSLFEKANENGKDVYYNATGLVSPARGIIGKYRKVHIPGGDIRYTNNYEKYYFKPGNCFPVFELDNGIKFAMMICYDRSFPETWRSYYLQGAQLIYVAACTMGLRRDMFVAELQTRALESHAFVVGLNRAGEEIVENESEPRAHFGKSLIINPLGDLISSLDDEQWSYVCAKIDTNDVEYARGRLNWERDRHPELYGIVSDEHFATPGLIFKRGF